MYLRKLFIQHVRNLDTTTLSFGPGFNYIHGANGAGKSALLEAIHILSRGRSFRSHRISSVIRHQQEELILHGKVAAPDGTSRSLAISRTRGGQTQIKTAGKKQSKISALAKIMPVQLLLPEAAELIFASPALRRGFMDWGLFHVEQQFLDLFADYRRVLAQRNAWLKTQDGEVGVDPWSAQLLQLAMPLHGMRQNYVASITPLIEANVQRLDPALQVQIRYRSGGLGEPDEAEKRLVESMPRDVKLGATHRGPHRSDLVFTVDQQPAAQILSRGQAKLLAGACILAQAQYLQQQTQTKSIFLVDDFGAELDTAHWAVFLDSLVELDCQIIATGTTELAGNGGVLEKAASGKHGAAGGDVPELSDLAVFHVEQGRFEAQKQPRNYDSGDPVPT